jgi:predicted O-methyltransferase YrrM
VIASPGLAALEVAYLPLDGGSPPNPRNAYSLAKASEEILLRYLGAGHALDIVSLRFPWLVDPAPDGPWGRQLHPLADQERPEDLAGGLSCLSFDDAARLIEACLRANLPGYRTYLPAVSVVLPAFVPAYLARYFPDVRLRIPAERMRSLIDLSDIERETGWRPLDLPLHEPPRSPAPGASEFRTGLSRDPPDRPRKTIRELLQSAPALRGLRRVVRAHISRAEIADVEAQLAREPGHSYTTDYVSTQTGNWTRLLGEYQGRPDVRFLEIGSYEGRSAVWFLENILTHPTARMVCVDLFSEPRYALRFDHNIRVSGATDRIIKLTGDSAEVLGTLPRESFDAIYLDGSKRAHDVLFDAINAWLHLKAGGVLIFDDYKWEMDLPPLKRPERAIDLFLEAFEGRYELLTKAYQVAVRKR